MCCSHTQKKKKKKKKKKEEIVTPSKMIRGAMACPGGAGVYFILLNTTMNASEYMELLKKEAETAARISY